MIATALGVIYTLAQTAATSNDPIQSFILWAGAALTAACGAVFNWFRTELKDCKEDRAKLFSKIETMHSEIDAVKDTVAELSVRAAVAERDQVIRDELADREAREDEGRPDSIPRIEYKDSIPRIEQQK